MLRSIRRIGSWIVQLCVLGLLGAGGLMAQVETARVRLDGMT